MKTAISVLKDDNGIFKLDFNISGSEDDLNFSILQMLSKESGSMIISKIVSVIANKAAVEFAPLLVSSIPVSPNNLLFFVNGVYKFATKVRFSDIDI